MLKDYETVVIYDPSIDEGGYEQQIQAFAQTVEQIGGRISGVDKWGRRQLAYQIKKKDDGYYAVIRYQLEPTAVRELERRLGLNELVLRQMTVVDEMIKEKLEEEEATAPRAEGGRRGAPRETPEADADMEEK